jgi:hypothetical protein
MSRARPALPVLVALALGASPFVAARTAEACAGCSNPNLLNARSDSAVLAPGEVSLALTLTGTMANVVHRDACPDIGPICEVRDEPPQLHDQDFYNLELRPIVAVGLDDVFSAELQLPLRLVRTEITFRRLDGTLYEPDYESIHHRDETLVGFADPWLLGRASMRLGRSTLTTRAGLGLPLGSTEPDPFAAGERGESHQHVQLGVGVPFPIFALDLSHALDRLRFGGYGQALVFVARNGHGYQAGNRYSGGLTGDVELGAGVRLGLGADLLNEQPERWDGRIQQDGNVGRTDLLVGGMASLAIGSVVTSLTVRVPVWQHFIEAADEHGDPGQLSYPGILALAVQTSFGGPDRGTSPRSTPPPQSTPAPTR